VISHRYKLIFIHIPKCAGRSISEALGEPFDHYTAHHYQTRCVQPWHEYIVFTTVRNPYSRLVSMYHYIKGEPFHANHPITNGGNMIPFKDWVWQNISSFKEEFDSNSSEGNRETDGDIGSPFWFSSQSRRISDVSEALYPNVHILKYEDGMPLVKRFLQQHAGVDISIPHINKSKNEQQLFASFYDAELRQLLAAFEPFKKDCSLLQYDILK
jgi:hypothetical protein